MKDEETYFQADGAARMGAAGDRTTPAPGTGQIHSLGMPKGFDLGPVRVSPPLLLAPMAGVTTPVLRELIAGYGGCGLYVSEMISSRRAPHETPRHCPPLRKSPGENPFLYQIFGNDPADMARAARHLMALEDDSSPRTAGIDINMGCSAPAIRRRGAGAALMANIDAAQRITSACRKVVRGALTVKLRIGAADDPSVVIRFARALVAEGADGITLHPRLVTEKFKRPASWHHVAALKNSLDVPVIGNGDILSSVDVLKRFQETGCDGVMIGRLAAARPWIFRQLTDPGFVPPGPAEVFDAVFEGICRHFRPEHRLRHLRLFTRYFARNFQFGHLLESVIRSAPEAETAAVAARAFFVRNPEESAQPRPALSRSW